MEEVKAKCHGTLSPCHILGGFEKSRHDRCFVDKIEDDQIVHGTDDTAAER